MTDRALSKQRRTQLEIIYGLAYEIGMRFFEASPEVFRQYRDQPSSLFFLMPAEEADYGYLRYGDKIDGELVEELFPDDHPQLWQKPELAYERGLRQSFKDAMNKLDRE